MRRLLILRHAKSSWKHPVDDHDRPLNKRGRHDAPRMGRLLVEHGLVPRLALCSTANRATSTLSLAVQGAGVECEMLFTHELYLAAPGRIVALLREVPDRHDTVMVVGHNPGMEELVEGLTGTPVTMPTAALAAIRCDHRSWSELALDAGATLHELWRPRELPEGS